MTPPLYRDTDIEFCPQCGESAEGVNTCDCLSDEQQEVEDRYPRG